MRPCVVLNVFDNINFGVYQFWCRGPRAPRDGPCDVVPKPRVKLAIRSRALGTPELVRQSVVENAVYDADIKFAFGALRHQGMGLGGDPSRDGWSWPSRAGTFIWAPRTCAPKCGAKRRL